MKVFRIYLDSFKYSYEGYWSSLEKACEELPKDADFQRTLQWNTPRNEDVNGISHNPDYEYNKSLKILVTISTRGLEVSVPGYRRKRIKTTYIPEVKEEGKPYSPEKQKQEELEPETINCTFAVAEVSEISVDQVKKDLSY